MRIINKAETKRIESKTNKTVYNSQYDFTINTSYAKVITNTNGLKNYTFGVYRAEDNELLENLLLQEQEDNTFKVSLVQYNLTAEERNILANQAIVNVDDKITYVILEDISDTIFNKAFLLVILLLTISIFSCKKEGNVISGFSLEKEDNFDIQKWENLNIEIISSYVEDLCDRKAKKYTPNNSHYNYIEISGSKILNEDQFNRFYDEYTTNQKTRAKCNKIGLLDSIFNDENKDFLKHQYTAKKNYIKLIEETDCIKNVANTFHDEKVEIFLRNKKYTFGKVLFTKNYKYAFLKFINPYGFGYIIFKNQENGFIVLKKCYLGQF